MNANFFTYSFVDWVQLQTKSQFTIWLSVHCFNCVLVFLTHIYLFNALKDMCMSLPTKNNATWFSVNLSAVQQKHITTQHEFRTFTAKEHFMRYCNRTRSWDRSVPIVTRLLSGYLRNCGLIPGRTDIFVSFPKHPDKFWSPHSFLFNAYQGLLPWG
jgi:hypothetical protein